MNFTRTIAFSLLAASLVCSGCSKPKNAAANDDGRVKPEPVTAEELARMLNTRIWKFVPPRIEGAERMDYQLMVSLKGAPPRFVSSLGVIPSNEPLIIALTSRQSLGADTDEKLGVYMGCGGVSGQTSCENFLGGMTLGWEANPRIEDDRITLLTGRKSGIYPRVTTDDAVLYLTWKARKKGE
jgi:hypothetical protein